MPGEDDTQKQDEQYEMKERQQKQNDQDEINNQFGQQDENAKRETTFIYPTEQAQGA